MLTLAHNFNIRSIAPKYQTVTIATKKNRKIIWERERAERWTTETHLIARIVDHVYFIWRLLIIRMENESQQCVRCVYTVYGTTHSELQWNVKRMAISVTIATIYNTINEQRNGHWQRAKENVDREADSASERAKEKAKPNENETQTPCFALHLMIIQRFTDRWNDKLKFLSSISLISRSAHPVWFME